MTHSTETTQPNSDNVAILIEWPNQPGIVQKAGRAGEALEKMQQEAERAVNRAMGTIHYMAYQVAKTIEAIDEKTRPDEAEVQFGITLDAAAGALLASTSAGAQLTVTLKWTIEQPQRVNVLLKE